MNKRLLSFPKDVGSDEKKSTKGDNPGESPIVIMNTSTDKSMLELSKEDIPTEDSNSTPEIHQSEKMGKPFNDLLSIIHSQLQEIKVSNSQIQEDVSNKWNYRPKHIVSVLSATTDKQKTETNKLKTENKKLKRMLLDQSEYIERQDQYNKRNNIIIDVI